jgi:hypothetical protein
LPAHGQQQPEPAEREHTVGTPAHALYGLTRGDGQTRFSPLRLPVAAASAASSFGASLHGGTHFPEAARSKKANDQRLTFKHELHAAGYKDLVAFLKHARAYKDQHFMNPPDLAANVTATARAALVAHGAIDVSVAADRSATASYADYLAASDSGDGPTSAAVMEWLSFCLRVHFGNAATFVRALSEVPRYAPPAWSDDEPEDNTRTARTALTAWERDFNSVYEVAPPRTRHATRLRAFDILVCSLPDTVQAYVRRLTGITPDGAAPPFFAGAFAPIAFAAECPAVQPFAFLPAFDFVRAIAGFLLALAALDEASTPTRDVGGDAARYPLFFDAERHSAPRFFSSEGFAAHVALFTHSASAPTGLVAPSPARPAGDSRPSGAPARGADGRFTSAQRDGSSRRDAPSQQHPPSSSQRPGGVATASAPAEARPRSAPDAAGGSRAAPAPRDASASSAAHGSRPPGHGASHAPPASPGPQHRGTHAHAAPLTPEQREFARAQPEHRQRFFLAALHRGMCAGGCPAYFLRGTCEAASRDCKLDHTAKLPAEAIAAAQATRSGTGGSLRAIGGSHPPAPQPDMFQGLSTDDPVGRVSADGKVEIVVHSTIAGFPHEVLLDSGATQSFIGQHVVDMIGKTTAAACSPLRPRRHPSDVTLADGSRTVSSSTIVLPTRVAYSYFDNEVGSGRIRVEEIPVDYTILSSIPGVIIGCDVLTPPAGTVNPFARILALAAGSVPVHTTRWGVTVPPPVDIDGNLAGATFIRRIASDTVADLPLGIYDDDDAGSGPAGGGPADFELADGYAPPRSSLRSAATDSSVSLGPLPSDVTLLPAAAGEKPIPTDESNDPAVSGVFTAAQL